MQLAPPRLEPNGMLLKWRRYRRRYGILHAVTRFIGTKYPLVWRLLGPWVSRSYLKRWVAQPGKKVINLGGGGNLIQGAITVDMNPRADTYADLRRPLAFRDGSVDAIFCEELIEHLHKVDGVRLLEECLRVLKHGGLIRIATPDVDWIAASVLDGRQTCDEFNSNFYEHGHSYLYTRAEIVAVLERAGFTSVKHSTYKASTSPLGYLDSHADRYGHSPLLSQYVDAIK